MEESPAMPVDSETLRAQPLFSALPDHLLERVAAISTVQVFPAGERLFDVGRHPSCLYVLCAGQVALGTRGSFHEFVAVEVMRAGDVFGAPAVLLDQPSLMGAETIEPSEIICIAAPGLRSLMAAEAQMAMTMLVSMTNAYRALVRQISDLKSRSVAQRLGCYLLGLAHEQGEGEIVLPFEKRLLASRLGTTPESLSRAFSVLRTCGVTTLGRKVVLGNTRVLRAFARPDELLSNPT